MTRKEIYEVKGVALEMKSSGKLEIITPTPIVIERPIVEVTIT